MAEEEKLRKLEELDLERQRQEDEEMALEE
jgi:hypothetical protein